MKDDKIQILLTNDDGIESPGLWAAAEALSEIGYVWVVAPREQSSGMGRSMPSTSDGIITPRKMTVHGKEWTVYAVGGSPAQAVQHGVLEILPEWPNLVVSGINYGSNVGMGITVSGTVGAALQGAGYQIPAIAVSLETPIEFHTSYSKEIDFRVAGYFTRVFAQAALDLLPGEDMTVLKIEVPSDANRKTEWKLCTLCKTPFYLPIKPDREDWSQPAKIYYQMRNDLSLFEEGTDTYTLLAERKVAVTPLSSDLSSRTPLTTVKGLLQDLILP